MSLTFLDLHMRFNPREVFTAVEQPAAANEEQRTLRAGAHTFSKTLGASTVPKLDKAIISRTLTLTTGVPVTIDLTAAAALALPGAATRTVDFTGAKVKAYLFRTKKENAATVTIGGGANPYELWGAGKDIVLGKDAHLMMAFRETESNLAAVSGTVKNLRFDGTTADVVYVELLLGT